ncbi:RidA family protein [Acuticoccus sp. I52.16.1]|uniref:RidA family protein n=1 Tax=Acuticoccus sp. I52.16.1 TaxID=2928472 RepID=UPI001FD1662B|nr:RidA family protein [Acuticoccus sp. I52.16.1]UOM37168.1 RidA family protein [Acuticoccus sp. I52.16.1]
MTIEKKNPDTLAPPIGRYKHLAVIPAGSDILCLAGQVGVDREGRLPASVEEQLENALKNIERVLASEGLDASAVFKINIWLATEIDMDRYVAAWRAFHDDEPPATTFAYVARLIQPQYLCEIEAWAARTPP